jgi:hypothetical protein
MPHPNSRFELQVEDDYELNNPENSSLTRKQSENARGRTVAGTMPHPGSRFELGAESDEEDEEHSKLSRTYSRDLTSANPNAKGRIVGGTMPHPSSRFETGGASPDSRAGAHLIGGALMNPDLRFHTGPGNIGSTPSTRVVQPPGGHSSNIFG